jgi:hypothetical protein
MDKWWKTGTLKRKEQNEQCESGTSSENPQHKQNKHKLRIYSDSYLKIGFTWTGSEDYQRPLCMICYEVLSNESLKPTKLCRHFETKHSDSACKPVEFFQRKLEELKDCSKVLQRTATGSGNSKAVEASYRVVFLIAMAGKPHTIREELILPAAKEMVSTMLGEKACKEMNAISLSNNTVQRRIGEMAENVMKQLT